MSHCPFGVEAENDLFPFLLDSREDIELKVYFIAHLKEKGEDNQEIFEQNVEQEIFDVPSPEQEGCFGKAAGEGAFLSLHGAKEVHEDMIQVVVQEFYPEYFPDFVLCRNMDLESDWKACAESIGMDGDLIREIAGSEDGNALFRENIAKSEVSGIRMSPTLLINGEFYRGNLNGDSSIRHICRYMEWPDSCSDIPVCADNRECRQGYEMGICQKPGTKEAYCYFPPPVQFLLEVITADDSECLPCSLNHILLPAGKYFPGMQVEVIDFRSDIGKERIKEYGIKILPAYIFQNEFARVVQFEYLKDMFIKKGGHYILRDEAGEPVFFFMREEKHKRFDVLCSNRIEGSEDVLEEVMEYFQNPESGEIQYHFFPREMERTVHVWECREGDDGALQVFPSDDVKKEVGEICLVTILRCLESFTDRDHLRSFMNCILEKGENEAFSGYKNCLFKIGLDEEWIHTCKKMHDRQIKRKEMALYQELGLNHGSSAFLLNNRILLKGRSAQEALEVFKVINSGNSAENN